MRLLTAEEAINWCAERGLSVDESGRPYFNLDRSKGFHLHLPKEPRRLPFMLLGLLAAEVDEHDEISGVEHLLWLRDWDIWPELTTSLGLEQINTLRRGLGIAEGLSEKPAMLFSGTELKTLISCALVPLVFGWDCYIIPSSVEYITFISHDEIVLISSKDEPTESRLIDELQRWGPKHREK